VNNFLFRVGGGPKLPALYNSSLRTACVYTSAHSHGYIIFFVLVRMLTSLGFGSYQLSQSPLSLSIREGKGFIGFVVTNISLSRKTLAVECRNRSHDSTMTSSNSVSFRVPLRNRKFLYLYSGLQAQVPSARRTTFSSLISVNLGDVLRNSR